MAFFPPQSKQLIGHLLASTLIAALFLAIAIGFSFLADWCVHTNRPAIVLYAVKLVEIASIIGDGILWLSLV